MKKKKQDDHERLSRRNFLHSLVAAGAVTVSTGQLYAHEEKTESRAEDKSETETENKTKTGTEDKKVKKPERPSEDSIKTNIETAKSIPRTKTSMPGRYPGVVSEIYHPKAVIGTKSNARIVASMLEAGMKLLTGEKDPKKAWTQFFSPKDKIGIKINPIGGKLLSNNHELISAIIASLEKIGVPKSNIIIWDRREVQMAEIGYTPKRYPGITCIGTEYMVKEGEKEIWKGEDRLDKKVFYEFDIVGKYDEETLPYMIHGGTKSYFTKIITEMVDKVINVPVLKNAGSSVTLCLKNMAYGVTSNTARGHQIWNRYNAEVCAFAPVRDKTVLNIIDGLKGCYDGGPGAVARFIWNANTIWVATDPVAADHIAWEKIFARRVKEGVAQKEDWDRIIKKADKLARAEKLGLGIYARDKIIHKKAELS